MWPDGLQLEHGGAMPSTRSHAATLRDERQMGEGKTSQGQALTQRWSSSS